MACQELIKPFEMAWMIRITESKQDPQHYDSQKLVTQDSHRPSLVGEIIVVYDLELLRRERLSGTASN